MSGSFIVTTIIVVTITLAVVIVLISLLRLYKERQEKQQQELEQLQNRCHRIVELLNRLSDRYLPITTKLILVEYLISNINYLMRFKMARDLAQDLPGYLQLHEELKIGQQASVKDKVQTHLQLSQVQQSLQAIPLLLRGFVSSNIVDKATAKDQVSQVRFLYCLAHHDLLMKEAMASYELDKKAAALEKLRLALAEMEAVATVNEAEDVITKLKNTIQRIENELFGNKSRAD